MSFKDCTEVSAACPVEATTYGYSPSLSANAILLTIFAVLFCVQTVMAFTTMVYSYSLVIAAGCCMEMLGYVGRILMHHNAWSKIGFRMQVVCLIISPAFTAAGIYLTLKHAVKYYGSQYSKLKPSLYTWIFIGCDALSILLQASGGGIASSARDDLDTVELGNDIIVAGIAFQVVTMAGCGILAIDFILRRYRHRQIDGQKNLWRKSSPNAKRFFAGVCFAYVAVLIRSIYRIPEMVGGWGNPRMRVEKEFLILDGMMIVLASISLTILHPAFFFPVMRTGNELPNDDVSSQELSNEPVYSTLQNDRF